MILLKHTDRLAKYWASFPYVVGNNTLQEFNKRGPKMSKGKKQVTENTSERKIAELPGPEELSRISGGRFVGFCLESVCGEDSEFVWQKARAVVRPRQDNENLFDIRLFDRDEAESMKVQIKDYTSLDKNPTLIHYEGWIENKPWSRNPQIDIEKKIW
jgi:hypothetical protein